jgi:hypothetical protein
LQENRCRVVTPVDHRSARIEQSEVALHDLHAGRFEQLANPLCQLLHDAAFPLLLGTCIKTCRCHDALAGAAICPVHQISGFD